MAKTLNVALGISGEAVNVAIRSQLSNNALRRYELPADEFPALATNKQVDATLDVSTASLVLIVPTVNVTFMTNAGSAGSPDDTRTLIANQGLIWWSGNGFDLSDYFTADVTSGMFFTSSDADKAGSVAIVILDDKTV